MDKCIIHKLAVDGARVEDGEVGVLNIRAMEVGIGVSTSMKSHAIDRVTLLVTSLNSHTISNQDILDILSNFSLPLLIAKDELVVPLISAIKDHLVIIRVVSIFLNLHTSVDDTELRGSDDKEHGSFISGAFLV
jgi:hypothetical protein